MIISTRSLLLKKQKKWFRNPIFIGFTRVMRLDKICGKSPAFFNGGFLLGNIDHMNVHINIHKNVHRYIYMNVSMKTHKNVPMNVHTNIHLNIHRYVHLNIHINIHMHFQSFICCQTSVLSLETWSWLCFTPVTRTRRRRRTTPTKNLNCYWPDLDQISK